MPKNVLVAIIVILVLGAGAAVYYQNQNKMGGNGPVASIKDALTRSVSMECNYTDDQGRTAKTYIKNGSVRSDYTGASAAQNGSMILANKKIYTWTADKKGFMMEVPDVTTTPSQTTAQNQGASQDEQMMNNLEKYKQYCKNATVDDSLFTPPSDVDFQDYSQMMQKTPTAPSQGMTQEQVQQYMQKYGQQK